MPKTIFLRALEADDKEAALRAAIRDPEAARGKQRFEVDPASFASVPKSPFAYWVSERLRAVFRELPAFEGEGRTAKCGAGTLDDFRFLRLEWELNGHRLQWKTFAKGGAFARFYASLCVRIAWAADGAEVKCFVETQVGSATRKIQAQPWYFRPGLSWPLRGVHFSAQVVPADCIFSVAGKMAFIPNDDLMPWLAILNSEVFDKFIAFFAGKLGGVQYQAGLIQSVPVPLLTPADRAALSSLARRAWSLKRSLDTRTETSHAFILPALLQVSGATLAERAHAWADRVHTVETELAAIQAEIDQRCFDLYGIDEADRRAITEGFGGSGESAVGDDSTPEAEDDAEDETEESETTADPTGLAAELVSWAAGVAFGRFDVRLALGTRPLPPEPEPFDPLPISSPGMLSGPDGLPLAGAPADYPLTFPADGLLADDPGHPRDLTAAVRSVFEVVFGHDADARWQEAAALLAPKDHDLRGWIAGELFEHHLKRHSKSRRKAPILWQVATPSASYSVWHYAHRLTKDSFYQVQNDFLGPKLTHEERKLAGLVQAGGQSPTASQRKEIAVQETLVEELRALLEEVKRVAPLWRPDLDDGVVLTMAPLWRFVPQHRAWQKELKAAWEKLGAGEYDWAHLAMHLWPERVVPKCAEDRSLAIAHGIEDVFWEEGQDGKWKARSKPTRPVTDLVRERTSPAVKEALRSLLEAPVARAQGKKGKRRVEQ